MKNIIKENNAGGLSIERYVGGKIVDIVINLELDYHPTGIKDLVEFGAEFGESWDSSDVSQDFRPGRPLKECIDTHDSTNIVADFDGETVKLYVEKMGNNAKKYFGIIER